MDAEERKKLRARHLLVEAAIDLTKIGAKMRRACMLVLVHGYTNAQASAKIGLPGNSGRQRVFRAIKRVKPKLEEIEHYATQYTKDSAGA